MRGVTCSGVGEREWVTLASRWAESFPGGNDLWEWWESFSRELYDRHSIDPVPRLRWLCVQDALASGGDVFIANEDWRRFRDQMNSFRSAASAALWVRSGCNDFRVNGDLMRKLLLTERSSLYRAKSPYRALRVDFRGEPDLGVSTLLLADIPLAGQILRRSVFRHLGAEYAATFADIAKKQDVLRPEDTCEMTMQMVDGREKIWASRLLGSGCGEVASLREAQAGDSPDRRDGDERRIAVVEHVTSALFLWMEATGDKGERRKTLSGIRARRRRARPDPRVWILGNAVTISPQLSEAADQIIRGDSKPRKGSTFKIKKQFVVRGHWRNQPCGKGRQDRKLIWVEPHYKGPEGKVAWAHVYEAGQ